MNLSRMKGRLLADLRQLQSPRGYLNAGSPRYNTLFGRDALISAWQTLKIDPAIAKSTLETLAQYQGKAVTWEAEEEPGKILHEFRFDPKSQAELPHWRFPYYGSVDSTPLFIIVAGEYFRRTRNTSLLRTLWNDLVSSFRWMTQWGDKDQDGYLEYSRRNPQGLFHQGWKDGFDDHLKITPPVAIVEAQGYLYAAYQTLAFLDGKLGKNCMYDEACARAHALKQRFNHDFWVAAEQYFALALDGEKKQRVAVTSNPGHLLFTGLVGHDKITPLIARLFRPDLWTPYGIRTHSADDADFDPYSYHQGSVWPHDNWIIYTGLKILGYHRHADKIRRALLQTFAELDGIPELYAVEHNTIVELSEKERSTANPLQAWASAGLLEMIWED